MVRRIAFALSLLVGLAARAPAAELFTLDRDPLSSEYTGPSGPLVLSGDIVVGDYDRLLARIAENPAEFFALNRIIVAADDGDMNEAIRIAGLLKSLLTEVDVGPVTGRCSGPCFLIYVAAARRGTDGQGLVGLYAPSADAASLKRLSDFLEENRVPSDLVERLLAHTSDDPYWLSETEEQVLGTRSADFEELLEKECSWSAELERAVYQGERPIEELKDAWACKDRLVRPAARHALCLALEEREKAQRGDAAREGAASPMRDGARTEASAGATKSARKQKQRKAAKKSLCSDPGR